MNSLHHRSALTIAFLSLCASACFATPVPISNIGLAGVTGTFEENKSFFRMELNGLAVTANAQMPKSISFGTYWPVTLSIILSENDLNQGLGQTDYVSLGGTAHHEIAPHGETPSTGITYSFLLSGLKSVSAINGVYVANQTSHIDHHGKHLDIYKAIGSADSVNGDDILRWSVIFSGEHVPESSSSLLLFGLGLAGVALLRKHGPQVRQRSV